MDAAASVNPVPKGVSQKASRSKSNEKLMEENIKDIIKNETKDEDDYLRQRLRGNFSGGTTAETSLGRQEACNTSGYNAEEETEAGGSR